MTYAVTSVVERPIYKGGPVVPRYVDAEQRRTDILQAASEALAEEGYGRLSLRGLARRMGGSSTLVTHYFATKEDLISGLVDRVLAEAEQARGELAAIRDPVERVRSLLHDFLPDAEETRRQEGVRVALVSYKDTEPAIASFFERIEPSMRSFIRSGLEGAVEPDRLEDLIDTVRVWVSGMVLSAVEHPEIWTPQRQHRACEQFLGLLPLVDGASPDCSTGIHSDSVAG
ncbi:MAG: TetR/AcrR family transcriptional regulator [Nocardioides sp.]|uniref:TetR/AcrR family transcriptional regulator n=1 Tax=Nocardioides sp. TaxID=35761 RepID=UPI0039E4018F